MTEGALKENEEALVMKFLPTIRRLAKAIGRRLPSHMRVEDLEAAGVIALLSCAQQADPERHDTFAAYARKRIEFAMLDELRRSDLSSRHERTTSKRIIHAMKVVQAREGHMEEAAVAAEIGVSVEQYRVMLERSSNIRVLSLDQPASEGGEEGGTLMQLVPARMPSALEMLLHCEMQDRVADALRKLPDRQRKVLALYYLEELSSKEIGVALDLTPSRVNQLHNEGIHALRALLEDTDASVADAPTDEQERKERRY